MNSKRPTSESWNSEMRCLPNAPPQSTAPQQARSRHGQVVPGNTSAEVEVEVEVEEGDGECNFQMCHFSVQFTVHRLEPLIPFRGVRFTLLLAFSWISRKLHHELRRKSGSAGSRGGHATPAPPPPIHQLPFPHSPLDLRVTHGISPYKMPGIKEWSDNLHGYLKGTFISSGHLS
jgi:hypothetical protein